MKNIKILASLEVRQKLNFERAIQYFKSTLKLNGKTMRYDNFVAIYDSNQRILKITYMQNLL